MQCLYSIELNPDVSLGTLEGELDKSLDRSVALYLTNLAYMNEVCQFSLVDKARRMAKYIKTEDDEKANTIIATNRITVFLQNNRLYNQYLKTYKISHYIDQEVVKAMFNTLSEKYTYKNYITNEAPTIEQDMEVMDLIVKKILGKSKEFEAQLEDNFINYDDDQQLLNHVMQKYVEGFNAEDENSLMTGIATWEEEKKFGSDLLRKCYKHNEELTADIEPNLKNWEMDRIATLDLVLMKMAVCELKYFPTVPIKVSINEYIDISKIYSTPKSKDFVNGVLDKTKIQLIEKGLVNKQGRGLVDS